MIDFAYSELITIQLAWLAIASVWMVRRNDEIPLLISFLIFYVTGYRYWAVTSGLNDWVNLSNFGILPITESDALSALGFLVVGQTFFLTAYLLCQKSSFPTVKEANLGISPFLTWLRPKLLVVGLFCLPLVILVRGAVTAQMRSGRSLAFGISAYLYLLPFVLLGVATLIICLWKFGGLPDFWQKLAAIVIIIGVANLTFSTSGRFQLIGWLATTAVIFSCTLRPERRLFVLGGFVAAGIGVFVIAGALRGNVSGDLLATSALDRFIGAEDANMLDGFVFIRRFFPDLVPYRWGMAHLEILLRPIPRAIWPNKPAGGGYLEAAGLSSAEGGFTIGISPTIFGDFYSEGGILAMVILSIIYGIALGKLIRWTIWLHPFAAVLVRAMVCASLVPILRGGDLAGIVAWLGMAFWPCFLLLWIGRKQFYLKPIYEHYYLKNKMR